MRINLITSLTGFPHGTANAKRINLIGKSIIASGNEFRVFTNSIQFNKFNNFIIGANEGISFEYLHQKQLKGNLSTFKKILYVLFGSFRLLKLFLKISKVEDIVYSYNHGNFFNVYIILLCKLFKIKLVQEINEWYHNDLKRKFEKLIIEGLLVKHSDAAIVISETIERKVLEINPNIKVLRIPVLENFSNRNGKEKKMNPDEKYCFWMGDVNGYLNDVLFIIKACADAYKMGLPTKFKVSGPYTDDSLNLIKELALQHNYPFQNISLLGYLSEEELNTYCQNAFLFIVPLWNDERSKSRFPTKIATFMKAGKPVISCRLGEISNLLTDSVNILYYNEGNYKDLAKKIQILFTDSELYNRICSESYFFAKERFNYLTYCNDVNLFFNNL